MKVPRLFKRADLVYVLNLKMFWTQLKITYRKNFADSTKYKSARMQTVTKYCRKHLAKEMLNVIITKLTASTDPINNHNEKPH